MYRSRSVHIAIVCSPTYILFAWFAVGIYSFAKVHKVNLVALALLLFLSAKIKLYPWLFVGTILEETNSSKVFNK